MIRPDLVRYDQTKGLTDFTSFADAATGLKVFHTAQDHIVKREKRRRIYHRCQYNTVAVFSWGETLKFTKSWIVCHLCISFHVCQYSGGCTISKCLLSRLYSECDYLFREFILQEMAKSTRNPSIENLNWIKGERRWRLVEPLSLSTNIPAFNSNTVFSSSIFDIALLVGSNGFPQ